MKKLNYTIILTGINNTTGQSEDCICEAGTATFSESLDFIELFKITHHGNLQIRFERAE